MLHENLDVNNNGNLTFAGYDTVALAKKYGTPLMLLDEERIKTRCKLYKKAMQDNFGEDSQPLFASKALSFIGIYKLLKQENMHTDIVSVGELYTAKKAGFDLNNAYFHGNNKSEQDIKFAIKNKVGYFIVDNKEEIICINNLAAKKRIKQKVLLRLTPGIDPHTHKAVSTGKVDSKFGVAIETGQAEDFVEFVLSLQNIELMGFHCHIGSQIFDIKPFCDAADIMIKFIARIFGKFKYQTKILNLGGGFGVKYIQSQPDIDYFKNIKEISKSIKATCKKVKIKCPTILMEPGRSIVADSGITLYTVGSLKEIPGYKNYVAVDGGMTDNPRYALYNSPYTVLISNRIKEKHDYKCTVAGKCCESGDLLQEDVVIPKPQRDDVLAVLVTGAYNYAMASNYNKALRPCVVMLSKYKEKIVIKRESLKHLIKLDVK